MNEYISLLFFIGLTLFIARRFMNTPVSFNRQGVRYLFLERLLAVCPEMKIVEETAEQIIMQIDGQVCKVQLEQLYLRCAEFPEHMSALIQQATGGIKAALQEKAEIPTDWENQVFPMLVYQESELPPDMITVNVTGKLSFGYALRNESTFYWITNTQLPLLNVSTDILHDFAIRNLERSCSNLIIDTPGMQADGQEHYLRFITADGLDAARLLIPSLYGRFSQRFAGDDLLVAIPTRDSLVMIGSRDSAIANFLAYRGQWEHNRRAYPITEQLLLVTESGVNLWPQATGQA